ncbi:heterokaryon incompatibility protein-domain-containing protein [Phaeosphaeriaceae sp. PMI808]|nr:heterokaryon incompatibility protein-domain-containing protein [Phaeosphaeriaceae sp. PMI808]
MAPTQAQSTASDESWSLATSWLGKCLENHATCGKSEDKFSWYPTRLLDLGDSLTGTASVRLIDSATETPSGNYCTLSHCWGKTRLIQLNQDTVQHLRSGIALEQLPKTFREAIVVTRRLQVRYIWIDSLCIVQDDLSDWLQEAALMHKVYSNSYCNLSASASLDSSQGLFRTRNPKSLHPTQSKVYVKDFNPVQDYVLCDIYDYHFWVHNVSRCIINKRGWVTQERLLSPRVIHFGSSQLFWECREHDACESYPQGLPPLFEPQLYTNFKALDPGNYSKKMTKRGQEVDPATEKYQIWNAIVKSYCGTLLTASGDKLVALSGIAKRLMSMIDDDYIAGMWRKYLESALLWQVENMEQVDGSPSLRPAPYRAPSWSWASIDGVVSTANTTQQGIVIRVCNVHLEYATDDTTGVVTGGWLDLRGSLKPFNMVLRSYSSLKKWYMVINDITVRQQNEGLREHDRMGPNVSLDVGPLEDDAFASDNAQQCLFFMVGRMPTHNNEYISVLLLRLVDAGKGVFERIGLTTSGPDDGQEMLLAELNEGKKQQLPCLRYEAGLHTIRMI